MDTSSIGSGYSSLAALGITGITTPSSTPSSTTDNSSTASSTTTPLSPRDQFRSDLSTLFADVQSGNITAAQDALKSVTQDRAALYSPSSQSPSTSTTGTSSRSADFQALIDAVTKGDAQGAKDALTKLNADRAAAGANGHHHHHHGGGAAPATTTATDPSTSAATSTPSVASTLTDTDNDGDSR